MGGGIKVLTHSAWNYYRQMLEHFISANLGVVDFYNTSQSGARINFSKELSFKECCERFLKQQKPKFRIPKQSSKKQAHILNQFYTKLRRDNNECESIMQMAKNLYNVLENILNSNKALPLTFLENVQKSIANFDYTLNSSKFFNDGKLSHAFIKRGTLITAVLEQHIKDEKLFLIHFINAYKTWLEFFIEQSSLKHTIIQKALLNSLN